MSSDLESIHAEIRQARVQANRNAGWIVVLLNIIGCDSFGAVPAALSGVIIPAVVLAVALTVLALWGLYRLIRTFCQGVADAAASWKNPRPADLTGPSASVGSRLFAIGLALSVFGGLTLTAMHGR
jgi:hypothetical protein